MPLLPLPPLAHSASPSPLVTPQGFRSHGRLCRKMVDLNVSAYIEGTAVALQAFEATGEGVIICTASMAGLLPVGAPPVYSATKACNIQMVRALASALDMEDSGIKMCARPCPPSIIGPGRLFG